MRRRGLVYFARASLLAMAVVLFLATPVLAAVAQPDTIDIYDVHAYRHCLEDNDLLVLARYNVDYTTNPDDSIEYNYLARLMDGTTELASCTPYSYYDLGYDWGVFSFYFDASDADIPTWEGSYTVRIEGNPTVDWGAEDPPLASTSSISWHATTTQEATEILLEQKVLYLADDLADRWQTTLTTEVTGGTVLNSAGTQYFGNSIDNLREMVPDIYPTGVEAVAFTEETHTQAYETTLMGRIGAGDILGDSRASLASTLNTSNEIAGAVLFFLFLGAVIWGITYGTGGQTKPIAFILIPLVIMGNLLGLLSLTFTMVIGLLSAIAVGYIFFYSKGAT